MRAKLGGADPRLISVWSMIAASAVFAAAALALWNWQPPVTALGWFALIGASVAMVIAALVAFQMRR